MEVAVLFVMVMVVWTVVERPRVAQGMPEVRCVNVQRAIRHAHNHPAPKAEAAHDQGGQKKQEAGR